MICGDVLFVSTTIGDFVFGGIKCLKESGHLGHHQGGGVKWRHAPMSESKPVVVPSPDLLLNTEAE